MFIFLNGGLRAAEEVELNEIRRTSCTVLPICITLNRIRILPFTLTRIRFRILASKKGSKPSDEDPDPAHHFDADPDANPYPYPNFQYDADPDPQHWL
jgi:hypothetical protein